MVSNCISVSSASAFATCPRRFYYSHELRWVPDVEAPALTFGKAWHALLERAAQLQSRDALGLVSTLIADGHDIPDADLAMLMAMACAFLGQPGMDAFLARIASTEERFCFALPGTGWKMTGIIDAVTSDGAVVEYKTTSRDLAAGSDYWTRLRFNLQVLAYSRLGGCGHLRALYVVARKPLLRPKMVPFLDEAGLKMVTVDATGERALTKAGKPKQTAGEGETLQARAETTEEFAGRLLDTIQAAPGDYFATCEMELDPADVDEALQTLATVVREVELIRGIAAGMERPERAWRRSCNEFNCANCPYAGPCLFTLANPADGVPAGFSVNLTHA